MKLPKPKNECAEPQPLAVALQKSRDLRKRKQRDSDAWLAARKVVKRSRKKPTGFKERTYELPKKGPGRGFRSDLQNKPRVSKTEQRRRQREAAARATARKKAERDAGNKSAPAPAPQKKRKEHPLRAKVKGKKRRK